MEKRRSTTGEASVPRGLPGAQGGSWVPPAPPPVEQLAGRLAAQLQRSSPEAGLFRFFPASASLVPNSAWPCLFSGKLLRELIRVCVAG